MTDSKPPRVWFITGSSSGFGRLLAEELLRRGERVIATAREVKRIDDLTRRYPETAHALRLDVTKHEEILDAVPRAIGTFGRVGYGVAGAIEEVAEDEFEPMFETNIYGLIRVTRAFLPHFRERRSGHIINLSSIGGLVGTAGWGLYNATKFAVEGFTEALAAELKTLGVRTTAIEPGPFRTEFLGGSGKLAKREISDYKETAGKTREYFKAQSGKQAGDPQKAVQAIVAVVHAPELPVHLLLGGLSHR